MATCEETGPQGLGVSSSLQCGGGSVYFQVSATDRPVSSGGRLNGTRDERSPTLVAPEPSIGATPSASGASFALLLDRENPPPSCRFTSGGKRSKSSLPLPLTLQQRRASHCRDETHVKGARTRRLKVFNEKTRNIKDDNNRKERERARIRIKILVASLLEGIGTTRLV